MKAFIIPVAVLSVVSLAGCTMNSDSQAMKPATTNEAMMKKDDAMPANDMMKKDDMMKEDGVMVGGALMVKSKDIVDNAVNSKDHTTLVAAVKAAGLVDTLKSAGPFTVFAPTNDAFAMLPAGTVDTLLKPENKTTLTKVLTYHVVPGKIMAADLKDGMKVKTVQGEELTFTMKDGKWYVNDAEIQIVDAVSTNGVTHVINKVLMPKN